MKTCLFCAGVPLSDVQAFETDAGIVFHVKLEHEGGMVFGLELFKTPCAKHQGELNKIPISPIEILNARKAALERFDPQEMAAGVDAVIVKQVTAKE